MADDTHLKRSLDSWNDGFRPDPSLESGVLGRIRRAEVRARPTLARADAFEWLRALWSRPLLAGGMAALFVLSGLGLSQLTRLGFAVGREESTVSYRLSIDPIYRLRAMAGLEDLKGGAVTAASEAQVMAVGLGWLQGQLRLSDGQYEVVSALHATYEKSFDELFIEMLESYLKYRQLDRRRMSNDVIDYVQLYDLLQTQRRLSEESTRLTGELLRKVSEVISPDQRERYERLLEQMYPNSLDAVGSPAPRGLDA